MTNKEFIEDFKKIIEEFEKVKADSNRSFSLPMINILTIISTDLIDREESVKIELEPYVNRYIKKSKELIEEEKIINKQN
jgi:hypothetical protein